MKGRTTWMVAALFAMVFGLVSWPGQAQMERRPGSFFIGDTDGDGIVAPRDVFGLRLKILIPSTELPNVVPSTGDNLDLDGDGAIGPGDFMVIQNWLLGNFASFPGRPVQLTPIPHPYIITGLSNPDSVELSAQAFAANPSLPLSGWGVIFKVDTSAGYCSAVQLRGRRLFPIPGGGRDQYTEGDEVFEYAGARAQGGKAQVKLFIGDCPLASQIRITVRIPADPESGSPGGRQPAALAGTTAILMNVYPMQEAWVEFCGGGVCSGSGNGLLPAAKPYLVADRHDGLHVAANNLYRHFNGKVWSAAITIPFAVQSLAVDDQDRALIAGVVGNEIYLVRWNGSSWEELGGSGSGGGISMTATPSTRPSLATGPNGLAQVAWEETLGSVYQIYYKTWDGTAWQELAGSATGGGVSNFSSSSESAPSLAVDGNNLPVIAYNYGSLVYLKKWDSAQWSEVGGSATGAGLGNGWGAILRLQANGFPAVFYAAMGTGCMYSHDGKFKVWNGSSWDRIYLRDNFCTLGLSSNYDFFLDAQDHFILATDSYADLSAPIKIVHYDRAGGWLTLAPPGCGGSIWANDIYPALATWQNLITVAWQVSNPNSEPCLSPGVYAMVYLKN